MRLVVLPQAVRNCLPDLISNTLEVVKLTSLAAVVALPELLFQARQAQSVTYNATPIMAAAVMYFLLLWPVVRLLSRLENRQMAGAAVTRPSRHRIHVIARPFCGARRCPVPHRHTHGSARPAPGRPSRSAARAEVVVRGRHASPH
jgi:hypothetical protein